MKLYRFSPIKNKEELFKAIEHVHIQCHKLCLQKFGYFLPVAGNIGIFCHYDEEFEKLTEIRKEMTDINEHWNRKYYKLLKSITLHALNDIPPTIYTHLYIRHPDPYRSHVGDVDFYMEPEKYRKLKESLLTGTQIKGVRLFERKEEDMVEMYDPDIDAVAFVSPHKM